MKIFEFEIETTDGKYRKVVSSGNSRKEARLSIRNKYKSLVKNFTTFWQMISFCLLLSFSANAQLTVKDSIYTYKLQDSFTYKVDYLLDKIELSKKANHPHKEDVLLYWRYLLECWMDEKIYNNKVYRRVPEVEHLENYKKAYK